MRKGASLGLLLVAPLLIAADHPAPGGFVTDAADLLPSSAEAALEADLTAFERQTGIEVAVVTVPSLGGETIETYAEKLFGSWGVGKKGKDNGVMLLVAAAERAVRIETGYGLEGDLPDADAHRIINEVMRPKMAADPAAGIVAGARAITATLGATPFADRDSGRKPAGEGMTMTYVLIVLAIFILLTIVGCFTGDPLLGLRMILIILSAGKAGGKSGGFGGGRSGGGGSSGKF